MSNAHFEAINPLNERLFKRMLDALIGQKVDEVFYAIVNYQERPFQFEGFHLCDQAVLIKCSNDKWLNWFWVEEGFYQTSEININTADIRNQLAGEFIQIKNVSGTKDWQDLIGKTIDSIIFKTIDSGGNKHISDLRLSIDNKYVSICAIDEPDPKELPTLNGLPYSANWTIIIFDDDILEKNKRMIA